MFDTSDAEIDHLIYESGKVIAGFNNREEAVLCLPAIARILNKHVYMVSMTGDEPINPLPKGVTINSRSTPMNSNSVVLESHP